MAARKMGEFEKAYLAGERSDKAIHKALINEMIAFHEGNRNTIPIQKGVVEVMNRVNPDGYRAKYIVKWLKEVGGFRFVDGNIKTTAVDYNSDWLDVCKAVPWYQGIKLPKKWSDPFDSAISREVEGLIRGSQTWDELAGRYAGSVLDSINAQCQDSATRLKAVDKAEAYGDTPVAQDDLIAEFMRVRNPVEMGATIQ